jgi:hypothetical protein
MSVDRNGAVTVHGHSRIDENVFWQKVFWTRLGLSVDHTGPVTVHGQNSVP